DRKDKKSKKKDKKKDDGNRFDDLPDGPAGTVLLSMSDDGTVVRGVRGTCEESGDASVEISSDSGASFEKVTPELTQVLHVGVSSDSEVWVVGTNDECEPRRFETDDLGETWDETSAENSWYLDPDAQQKVHTPRGGTQVDCVPTSVITIDSEVGRVGCEDGSIRGTDDAGDEWVTLGSLEDLEALTYEGPGTAYALTSTQECAGQVFASDNGGSAWDEADCLEGDRAHAIAVSDQAVLAQVGSKVFRSTDGGESWDAA